MVASTATTYLKRAKGGEGVNFTPPPTLFKLIMKSGKFSTREKIRKYRDSTINYKRTLSSMRYSDDQWTTDYLITST